MKDENERGKKKWGNNCRKNIYNLYCFKHRQKDVRNMKSDGRKAKERERERDKEREREREREREVRESHQCNRKSTTPHLEDNLVIIKNPKRTRVCL